MGHTKTVGRTGLQAAVCGPQFMVTDPAMWLWESYSGEV